MSGCFAVYRHHNGNVRERIFTPITEYPASSLAGNFTWSDVNGTDFLTIAKNQHIP
jgi:hypothetical protein